MLTFSLLIGTILVIAGAATYFLAPRVGPNPIFGMRVGYAYASREIWDKTNRFGGMLFVAVGIGVAIFGMVLQFLNVAGRDAINILTITMLAALLGATAWVIVYARRLAQGTAIARELVTVRFRWVYLAPILVTFVLLVALAAYIYPTLPVERVPSHFNINDMPDGWQPRDEFILTFVGISALFVALNIVIVFVATREPLIAFARWGSSWRMDPERGLIFAGLAFSLVNLILFAVLWNIWWFATRGALAFSFWWILWLMIPLIAIIIALFFALARRAA